MLWKEKKWWALPKWRRNQVVERYAVAHAAGAHEPMPQLVAEKYVGVAQPFDPEHNDEHRRLAELATQTPQTVALRTELTALRKELAKHYPRVLLWLGLLITYVFEVAGYLQFLILLGIEGVLRVTMAFAFAAGIIVATKLATKPGHGRRNNKIFYASLALWAVIVIAIAIVNLGNTTIDEGSSISYDGAAAIVMVFTTIAPAAAAKVLLDLLEPVEPLARRKKQIDEDIKKSEEVQRQALEQIHRIESWHAYVAQEAAQITATYLLAYKSATPGNPYATRTT